MPFSPHPSAVGGCAVAAQSCLIGSPVPPPVVKKGKQSGKGTKVASPAPVATDAGTAVVQVAAGEFAEAECQGQWQDLAFERLDASTKRRKAQISPELNADAEAARIDKQDFGVRVQIGEAKSLAACKEVMLRFGQLGK